MGVKNWCPTNHTQAMECVKCFCGLTDKNSNPFAPWPTTTTTTLPLSPCPPLPPPTPTPPPPPPPPTCMLKSGCLDALKAFNCKRYGGVACFSCLHAWQPKLTPAGCPLFND